MKLYINGKPAVRGQKVKTFRGEEYILIGWREPHKPSSSGFVHVKKEGADDRQTAEYYAPVVNGKFMPE